MAVDGTHREPDTPGPAGPAVEEAPAPRGAALVTLLYLALIVVAWGYMYWLLLSRG